MEVYLDIPYGTPARSPLHRFDLYNPVPPATDPSSRPLLCFVHGGAWRTEDKKDHAELARNMALHTSSPIVVPNYRLTPLQETEGGVLRHPSHAEDILQFLEFLLVWDGPSGMGRMYDPKRLFLMGHSCGAHMLSSVLLDSSKITPSLTPSPTLLDAVKGVILSEGIYDLDMLISHFPAYLDWFIASAFGRLGSYAALSTTAYPLRRSGISWLIIHSQGDTLVDLAQSERMLEHLKSEYGQSADSRVFHDTSLTKGHDAILATEDFIRIVCQFIQGK